MTCPITNDSDGKTPLHFCISLETQNKWSLIKRLHDEVGSFGLVVEDLRTMHARGVDPVIKTDVYVRDKVSIQIATVNSEIEIDAALEKCLRSNDLLEAINKNKSDNLDAEDRMIFETLKKQLEKEDLIEERKYAIEAHLRKKLNDLAAKIDVQLWDPWNLSAAMDIFVLNSSQKAEIDLDFFLSIFEKADADKSGEISGKELCKTLSDSGMTVTREGVNALLFQMDEDRDGNISREEFTAAASFYLKKIERRKDVSLRNLLGLPDKTPPEGNIVSGSSPNPQEVSFPIRASLITGIVSDNV